MIVSNDGYQIIQDVNNNRIIIVLPQTWETANNTVSPVKNRKKMLDNGEESILLGVVKALFENERISND